MIESFKSFCEDQEGQTATEYMLIISVIVIACVAAAYFFVPSFQTGVQDLASDVSTILDKSPVSDLEILRALIRFKKEGAITVVAAAPATGT